MGGGVGILSTASRALLSVEKEVSSFLGWFEALSSSSSSLYCSMSTNLSPSSYISLCYWTTIWLLGFYMFRNAFAWYQFVVAWNVIARTRRTGFEASLRHRLRTKRLDAALWTRRFGDENDQVEGDDHMGTNRRRRRTTPSSSPPVECPVCLVEFRKGDLVRSSVDACEHVFHAECLSTWLRNHDSCPCCRHNFCAG